MCYMLMEWICMVFNALYTICLSDLNIICNKSGDLYRRVYTEIVLDFTLYVHTLTHETSRFDMKSLYRRVIKDNKQQMENIARFLRKNQYEHCYCA